MANGAEIAFVSVALLLIISGIVLHSVGLYMLRKMNNFARIQKLVLTNLSIAEIILLHCNFFNLFAAVFNLHPTVRQVAVIVPYYNFCLVALTFTLLLTIDRFVQIRLHLHYHRIISEKKPKTIILIVWISGALSVTAALFVQLHFNINMIAIAHKYIYIVANTILIGTSIAVYSYVYQKLHKSKEKQPGVSHNVHQKKNIVKTFIPFWILMSTICFYAVPETTIAVMFYYMNLKKDGSITLPIMILLFNIGHALDATIYIFLDKSIRKKFFRLMASCRASPTLQRTNNNTSPSVWTSMNATIHNEETTQNDTKLKEERNQETSFNNQL